MWTNQTDNFFQSYHVLFQLNERKLLAAKNRHPRALVKCTAIKKAKA